MPGRLWIQAQAIGATGADQTDIAIHDVVAAAGLEHDLGDRGFVQSKLQVKGFGR
jgi:hypothetical protein